MMTPATITQLDCDDRSSSYRDIDWHQFKLIQAGFASARGVRLCYDRHTLEILMPGRNHEVFSRLIGFLIGLFCLEKNIESEPTGAMTQELEGQVSVQADESYCFGASKPTPDLAIEIVLTSSSIRKLQRYQLLAVPEVWFWEDGAFSLYRLRADGYVKLTRSEIPELIDLDIELLTRCLLMAQTSRLAAANEFRNSLNLGS